MKHKKNKKQPVLSKKVLKQHSKYKQFSAYIPYAHFTNLADIYFIKFSRGASTNNAWAFTVMPALTQVKLRGSFHCSWVRLRRYCSANHGQGTFGEVQDGFAFVGKLVNFAGSLVGHVPFASNLSLLLKRAQHWVDGARTEVNAEIFSYARYDLIAVHGLIS